MKKLNRFFLLSLGGIVLGTRAATVVYSPEATYNTLAHEFPNGYTAITAQNDPSVVGYCLRAPASGQWAEFDITAAVKRGAGRTGKLAFVVSSMSNRGEHNTPTTFVANSSTNVALRPQFVASWEEGTSCGAQS